MNGKTKNKFIQPQDTIPVLKQDTLQKIDSVPASISLQKDTTKTDSTQISIKKYSQSETDSIFIQNELRLKRIESQRIRRAQQQKDQATKEIELQEQKVDFESNSIIFSYDSLTNWPDPYFLDKIQLEPVQKASREADFYIYEDRGTEKDNTQIILINPKSSVHNQNRTNAAENSNHAWYLIIFLLVLAQLARVRLYYGKYFAPVFYSLVSYKTENNLYRNKNTPFIRFSFGLNTIFFLIAPIFFLQVSDFFELNILNYNPIINYLILVGVFILWYFIKFIVLQLIGYISFSQKLFSEYFFSFSLSVKNIALFLIPVSIFEAYIDTGMNHLFIYLGLVIIGLVYLLRVFRLLYLFLIKRFSVLYGILYLCALEILPILILIRILFLSSQ
ncbi:MAG: DUF4271 domain-containing protein [Bacteroidales bacterium]|nr:DUF4271 domain-containing protein [Bacteroidales bacterium]